MIRLPALSLFVAAVVAVSAGCVGTGAMIASTAVGYAPWIASGIKNYADPPEGIQVVRDDPSPFTRAGKETRVNSIMVDKEIAREALTESGAFENVALIERGVEPPRNEMEAAETAQKNGFDAFMLTEYSGEWRNVEGGMLERTDEYGRAHVVIVLADGSTAYEQTVRVRDEKGTYMGGGGGAPTQRQIQQYLAQGVIDDLKARREAYLEYVSRTKYVKAH